MSHMFYCCVQILCWNLNRVRKVHISLYQQSRCLKETNETKVLVIFSICSVLHSKTEISYVYVKFQRGKIPALLKKKEVDMRIQRNQKQVETRYYLSTVDIHVAHIDLTYIQSD